MVLEKGDKVYFNLKGETVIGVITHVGQQFCTVQYKQSYWLRDKEKELIKVEGFPQDSYDEDPRKRIRLWMF